MRGVAAMVGWCAIVAIAGCSLPRSTVVPSEVGNGGVDTSVAGRDAGRAIDGSDDVLVPGDDAFSVDDAVAPDDTFVPDDVFTPDAYVAPVDMGSDAYAPPDMGVDAWSLTAACNAAYGSQPGYHLCSTTATGCVFYVNWSGSSSDSCAHACGTRCTAAIGNMDGSQCTTDNSPISCTQGFQDAICTCTP